MDLFAFSIIFEKRIISSIWSLLSDVLVASRILID